MIDKKNTLAYYRWNVRLGGIILFKMKNFVLCILYIVLSLCGMTFIKMGSGQQGQTLLTVPATTVKLTWRLVIGMLFYGGSFLLYIACISRMKIAIIIPLMAGINSVLIVIIGVTVFKERVNLAQVLGILIVIIGSGIIGCASSH